MEDVKRALESAAAGPPRAQRRRLWVAAAALGLLLAAGLFYLRPFRGRPAGHQPVVLTEYPGQELYPSLAPDGRWMYFRSASVPPDGFFRVPAEGGPHAPETWRRVTSAPNAVDGNPSPDGKLFLYTWKDRPGLFAIPA